MNFNFKKSLTFVQTDLFTTSIAVLRPLRTVEPDFYQVCVEVDDIHLEIIQLSPY